MRTQIRLPVTNRRKAGMTSNHHAPYGLGYTRTTMAPTDGSEAVYQTAGDKPEEGGDDVKSSCPLWPGLHTYYNGAYRRKRSCEVEQTRQMASQFGLKSATRLHEVGIASNRGSACRGEYVPGPCTHRPSNHGSRQRVCNPTS